MKLYEEIDVEEDDTYPPGMHGAAVASLAVGQNCGVAKDADLYFIGTDSFGDDDIRCESTCRAIDRILEINKKLPADRKIRVISISRGYGPEDKDFDKLEEKVNEANKEGIFVNTVGADMYKNIDFGGLKRSVLSDADDPANYQFGGKWLQDEYMRNDQFVSTPHLLVPMDNRTFASCQGQHLYEYNSDGGMSWATPYFAACYALACQVYPQITPNQFFELAIKTGDMLNDTPENTRKDKENARIINMAKLIEELKKL